MPDRTIELAALAYATYCRERGGQAVNGDPLPGWADVKPDIQRAWIICIQAVEQRIADDIREAMEALG